MEENPDQFVFPSIVSKRELPPMIRDNSRTRNKSYCTKETKENLISFSVFNKSNFPTERRDLTNLYPDRFSNNLNKPLPTITINKETGYSLSFFKAKNSRHKLIHINKHLFSSNNIPSKTPVQKKVQSFINVDNNIKEEISNKLKSLKRYNSVIGLENKKVIDNKQENKNQILNDYELIKNNKIRDYIDIIKDKIIILKENDSKNNKEDIDKRISKIEENKVINDKPVFPLFGINSTLCFPQIIKDRNLLFNLWNENIDKLRYKNVGLKKVNSYLNMNQK